MLETREFTERYYLDCDQSKAANRFQMTVLRHWAMSKSGADYTHVGAGCQPIFIPLGPAPAAWPVCGFDFRLIPADAAEMPP